MGYDNKQIASIDGGCNTVPTIAQREAAIYTAWRLIRAKSPATLRRIKADALAERYVKALCDSDATQCVAQREREADHQVSRERGWPTMDDQRRALIEALREQVAGANGEPDAAHAAKAPGPAKDPAKVSGRKRKVWAVSYIPGNPEVTRMGVYTDASGPHLRKGALDAAQKILTHSPRWRLWVHHTQTGERIFESDSEKDFQAKGMAES